MTKTVLVTGASSGIGRNCAVSLAKAGYTVIATARRKEALTETASMASAGKIIPIACDISDEASVDGLFVAIREQFDRLDVVFNNAGNNVAATNFGDLSFENWRHVISVNLDGAFLIANRAYKMMRDQSPQGGRIINNGSISAHAPAPDLHPTRLRNMPSQASPVRSHWMGASTILPVGRSISAMLHLK